MFQEKEKVCKENFLTEVSDHRIYTGEILIVNKVFDEILQTEEKKSGDDSLLNAGPPGGAK